MLPKPEKNKKNLNNSEQLDLVESLSQENKVNHKRRFIIIFLLLTVGLSTGFWTYHRCRIIIINHQFPSLALKLPQLNQFNSIAFSTIDSHLPKDASRWSIHIETLTTNKKPFLYAHLDNDLNVDQITQTLLKLPVSSDSLTQANLPSGIQVQEISEYQNSILILNSLITVPQKQIVFIFKVSSDNPEQDKKIITSIIEQAYYQIMNSN